MTNITRRDFLGQAAAASAAAAIHLGPAVPDQRIPRLTITLKPGTPDERGNINFVDVIERIEKVKADAGNPLLSLPTAVANVQTVALSIEYLSASDDAGSIPLTVRDDQKAGETQRRTWLAGRAVDGSIDMQYRVPITNLPNPLGAAPPLELRTEEGAFSGAASTFIVLPETVNLYAFNLHWDLSALPSGAGGMSSLGVGDLQIDAPQSLGHLKEVLYFFGGMLHRFPARPTSRGFFSAWQGTPPFDGEALMRWTEQLHNYYLSFFRPEQLKPFGVLLRRNPINAGGGVEVGNSFIGTFDAHTKVEPLKITVAHEMVHTFVGGSMTPRARMVPGSLRAQRCTTSDYSLCVPASSQPMSFYTISTLLRLVITPTRSIALLIARSPPISGLKHAYVFFPTTAAPCIFQLSTAECVLHLEESVRSTIWLLQCSIAGVGAWR